MLSGDHSRTVGFEDPVCHQMRWFNLYEGNIHHIPDVGLYFKLEKIANGEDQP